MAQDNKWKQSKPWAQDIQAGLCEFEGDDKGYAEWCSNHCRICGKPMDDYIQDLGNRIMGMLEAIATGQWRHEVVSKQPNYPVEYLSNSYRQILCSPECEREWLSQFPSL